MERRPEPLRKMATLRYSDRMGCVWAQQQRGIAMNSISDWIASLKGNDAYAAEQLWNRYSSRLVDLAKHKLGKAPKTVADEDDIAQSVFRSLCRGAAAGRFADIRNRDDLWWLLLAITKQKVVDHVRRESAQKRGAGLTYAETAMPQSDKGDAFNLDWLAGDDPTPDLLVMLEEQSNRLLKLLRDDNLRSVAISRIEGYTVNEIATILAISTRSVERKLQLIRKAWSRDLLTLE